MMAVMTFEEICRRAAEEFEKRVRSVPDDAWSRTTKCCPDWTIHDLVNHVVNENKWIPPLLAGETIADVGNRFDGDLLGGDAVNAYREAAADVLDAVRREGALGGSVTLSSGPTPAEHYVAEVVSDQIIHTWDLASSIGQHEDLPPDILDFAGATLRPLAEEWRKAGALGPPVDVPDDADDQTKLLALLGRRG